MNFLAPGWMLAALAMLAALIAGYVWVQLRRRSDTARFTNLALLDRVAPRRPGWRRHVSAGLVFAMLGVLAVALGRPAMPVEVPRERATIIVAIDVSPSMVANDIDPDRITAAKKAAVDFVESLPDRFNVGLVSFSATAGVVASPSQDHQAVADSVHNLQISPGTAIGEGVFASLQSIQSFDDDAEEDPPPAAVVLLSDGENTSGRPISSAVRAAADAEVPVSTIAFGTGAALVEINGEPVEANIDKEALERLASDTGGHFYEAESGAELSDVYDDIGSSLGSEIEYQENLIWWVRAAALLGVAAVAAALAWSPRLP
ncbi:VWA domain-containing protein [Nocardiopsis composta]|uniref:Ca-activated chloride channel family protein n=1 Tax=Nocardiopsis composta TaxID=157465 RepID=A0A7W8VCA2_9ACTN|nr:Ca-activated chloride channel family protein [Nocardiopsis composta]